MSKSYDDAYLYIRDLYNISNEILKKEKIFALYKGKEWMIKKVNKRGFNVVLSLEINYGNGKKSKRKADLTEIKDMYIKENI